jgi:tetratricopeptide (TPR) repeat protein
MNKRILRITRTIVAIILCLGLLLPPQPAFACGPFFPITIFIQSRHPDLPLEKYAAGEIGIVQPSYSTSYLVVAYRHFSGQSFDASEQQQLVALWNHHLNGENQTAGNKVKTGQEIWADTWDELSGLPAHQRAQQPKTERHGRIGNIDDYQNFDNCLDDAFRTAARTLRDRAQRFGSESAAVQSWLVAQETVFLNCAGPNADTKQPFLPEAAETTLPQIIRVDRDYQIAAAYFYGGKFEEAKERFRAIAADSSSPWRATAALVAARCLIRAATLGTDDEKIREARFSAADSQLRVVLANPAFKSVFAGAERLRGFVEFRVQPDARLVELGNSIEKRSSPGTLRQDLDDYAQLIQRAPEESIAFPAKISALREQSAITDWILTFKSQTAANAAHALQRWQETHSPAWLVAALACSRGDSSHLVELLDAAAKLPSSSAAFLSVSFHRARLLAESGGNDQARQELDNILKTPPDRMMTSARNLLLALRMKLARSLGEFLEFAPRQISVVTSDGDDSDLPDLSWCRGQKVECEKMSAPHPEFDADAAQVMTQAFPTRLLADAAVNPHLPDQLRLQLAQAAWTKALFLNDDATASRLAPLLSSLAPNLAGELKAYSAAPSSAERNFAAVFLVLHHPEMRPYISTGVGRQSAPGEIDDYRDNWWCCFTPPPEGGYNYYSMYTNLSGPLAALYPDRSVSSPSFLPEKDRQLAEKEWNTIRESIGGSSWLGQQVLEWAKSHPDDPRVPEALHFAVRATRYGCSDDETGKYSKAAFELLHRRYAQSEWTKKTPYWFN